MNKTDLGTGHIVTFRNGFRAMVYRGIVEARADSTWLLNNKLTVASPLNEYNLDMTHLFNEEYDIVKVEAPIGLREIQIPVNEIKDTKVIWSRPVPMRIAVSLIRELFKCEEFVIVEDEDA